LHDRKELRENKYWYFGATRLFMVDVGFGGIG
jgi:hypothetical protein